MTQPIAFRHLALAATLALAMPALAQTRLPDPTSDARPEESGRPAEGRLGAGPTGNDIIETPPSGVPRGALEPPAAAEPGIRPAVPDPSPTATPVIPTPGVPGGDPTVRPR